MPASDHENTRGSKRFGEGSTRSDKDPSGVRILGAQKAPVERCAGTFSPEAGGSE